MMRFKMAMDTMQMNIPNKISMIGWVICSAYSRIKSAPSYVATCAMESRLFATPPQWYSAASSFKASGKSRRNSNNPTAKM